MTRRGDKPGLLERLGKLSELWKLAVLPLAALVLIGIRFETWQGSLARAEDVAAVRREAADLAARSAVQDATLADLRDGLRELKADLLVVHQQIVEVAKSTGARQVPAP